MADATHAECASGPCHVAEGARVVRHGSMCSITHRESQVNHRTILAAVGLLVVAAGTASAQGTALSLRAGTLGPSIGVTQSLNRTFNLRVDVPYLTVNRTEERMIDDFPLMIDASIRLFSVAGLVDVHPFGGAFRLSAGAAYNDNEATFTGRASRNYTVRGRAFTPDEIGDLTGLIELGSSIAPYLGLGFGNPVALGKRLGMTFDAGVLFSGPPRVTMTGTGMVAPTADEAPKLEQNLDWVRYYPGISLGLTYKLF
jgi:hypothetical protein